MEAMKSVEDEYYSRVKRNGLLVGDFSLKDPTTRKVLSYVNEAFKTQKDRGGYPYLYHLLYVASHVSENAVRVALLHDAMEDQGATEEDLRALGLSEKEIEAVELLTRHGGEETDEGYFAYVEEIRKKSPLAYEVKQADLAMNGDLRRLPSIASKGLDRSFKYEAALRHLGASYLLEKKALAELLSQNSLLSKEKDLVPALQKALEQQGIPLDFLPRRTALLLLEKWNSNLIQTLDASQSGLLLFTLFDEKPTLFKDLTPSSFIKEAFQRVDQEWVEKRPEREALAQALDLRFERG
jgi:hypothetical protein